MPNPGDLWWNRFYFFPLPKFTVYMLQSMSKLLDTSRDLLKDLQDSTTTTTTAATTKQLPGKDTANAPKGGKGNQDKEKGGGDAAVTVRPAEEILSGIKGLLRYGHLDSRPLPTCVCVLRDSSARIVFLFFLPIWGATCNFSSIILSIRSISPCLSCRRATAAVLV